MPVTPTGWLSEPMKNLGDLIASTSAFQSWCGAADSVDALRYVIYIAEDIENLRDHFVLIKGSSDWHANAIGDGPAGFSREVGGTIGIRFEGVVDAEYQDSHGDAYFDFMNRISAIVEEMDELSATDGYFATKNIRQLGEVVRATKDEAQTIGDRQQIEFDVDW